MDHARLPDAGEDEKCGFFGVGESLGHDGVGDVERNQRLFGLTVLDEFEGAEENDGADITDRGVFLLHILMEAGHDLAHFLDVTDIQFGHQARDRGIDFGIGHLLRHEFLDNADLAHFTVIQILTACVFISRGGFLTLFHHRLHHGQNFAVADTFGIAAATGVNVPVLDPGINQAHGGERQFVLGFHRFFHRGGQFGALIHIIMSFYMP